MEDEVKLYGQRLSPFVCRAKIALNLKGVKYQNCEEDLSNKSPELLKHNPVYKKVPVLVHNGKSISESFVIVEYIDEVWKGVPILPRDPYEKSQARFWAKFVDDKIFAIYKAFSSRGDEQAIAEGCEQLQILENELKRKGTKFFGGDNIGFVDIAADFVGYWVGIMEETADKKIFTKDKYPNLVKWADDFANSQEVNEILPQREPMIAYYKKNFGLA